MVAVLYLAIAALIILRNTHTARAEPSSRIWRYKVARSDTKLPGLQLLKCLESFSP